MEVHEVDAVAGEPAVLPFGLGPALGLRWSLDLPPGVVRIEDTAPAPVDPAGRLGSSVGSRMQVVADAGEHTVRAYLGAPGREPARTVVVHLHVAPRPEG